MGYVREDATPKTFIIGIAGPLGSGKTTMAKIFEEKLKVITNEILYIPFARKVKEFAYQLGWDGNKDEKGRKLLQLIGTECGRQCIGEDIWTNFWRADVIEKKAKYVITDDVRFENEVRVIKEFEHRLIKIKGRNEVEVTEITHASELGLEDSHFTHIFFNNRRRENIELFVDEIIWEITNGGLL